VQCARTREVALADATRGLLPLSELRARLARAGRLLHPVGRQRAHALSQSRSYSAREDTSTHPLSNRERPSITRPAARRPSRSRAPLTVAAFAVGHHSWDTHMSACFQVSESPPATGLHTRDSATSRPGDRAPQCGPRDIRSPSRWSSPTFHPIPWYRCLPVIWGISFRYTGIVPNRAQPP
jgi:hypothetical protein